MIKVHVAMELAMFLVFVIACISPGCDRGSDPSDMGYLSNTRFGQMWLDRPNEIDSINIPESMGREILHELSKLRPVSASESDEGYEYSILFQSGSSPVRFEISFANQRVYIPEDNAFFSGHDLQRLEHLINQVVSEQEEVNVSGSDPTGHVP